FAVSFQMRLAPPLETDHSHADGTIGAFDGGPGFCGKADRGSSAERTLEKISAVGVFHIRNGVEVSGSTVFQASANLCNGEPAGRHWHGLWKRARTVKRPTNCGLLCPPGRE